ncbi:methyl-accepting chemotaxis protein [uncultured Vibrio sp.]|uniref:methyl-accepting chemotaxis protein n=1 Tax=uncultured Vibrio sp. TaxID=114054 RepID=UPI0025CFF330|nr:methyl-accepting chemotaxis protein [uncultured Vibrio sp.]
MKNLLQRFPLYLVVSVMAGIPILIAISLSISVILESHKTASRALLDQEVVDLALIYDDLAHNIAVERGLTAGVLGSKGNKTQVDALTKQRGVVDLQIKALERFNLQHADDQLTTQLLIDVKTELNALSIVRSQVDTLSPNVSPFAYYSHLNQLAIDNATVLIETMSDSEMASLGGSLLSIMVIKEKAGQVRGALNGAFSRGSATAVQYTSIAGYINESFYAERLASITLPPQYLETFNQTKQSSEWRQVTDIQKDFLSQKSTLEQLSGPQPSAWFALATKRIGLVNDIRNQLKDTIIDRSHRMLSNALFSRNLFLSLTIVFGSVILFTLFFCVQNLRLRVNSLTNVLSSMSDNRDLSQSLNVQGKDEISKIKLSINGLTTSIRNLLVDVTSTNDHSSERLDRIVENSENLGQSSRETTAKCDNIAAAMTELSQSSLEIASSTDRALEETRTMTEKVLSCQSQSNQSFSNVEHLVQQIEQTQTCMSELENDAKSVRSIVDTISGISEQTNLLALNAAIEAARAGEHGRGFAVVSSEVRDLAQRSKDATESISELLKNMTVNTNTAVQNMNKSKEDTDETFKSVDAVNRSITELETVIEQVDEHITSIANSTTEQSNASEAVDRDIDVLAGIAQNTGVLAESMNKTVSDYKREVSQVDGQLREFKLG